MDVDSDEKDRTFEHLLPAPSPKDINIEALQEEIQELKTRVNEDRFIAIGLFVILFDGYIFEHMNNWGSPIALLVVEFLILAVLARKLNIEDVTKFSDKLIDAIGFRAKKHE